MFVGNISKKNQKSPEWGVKANPNKQCWLLSGRYCRVSLHHTHQKSPQDMSPEPQSQTSPVILHESQARYQRKLNASAKARMRWQMRTLLPAGGSELWWNGKCWELLQNNSWKAFCGLESDLRVTATVSPWHLAVKLNNTQPPESLDKTQIFKAIGAANPNQSLILTVIVIIGESVDSSLISWILVIFLLFIVFFASFQCVWKSKATQNHTQSSKSKL